LENQFKEKELELKEFRTKKTILQNAGGGAAIEFT